MVARMAGLKVGKTVALSAEMKAADSVEAMVDLRADC